MKSLIVPLVLGALTGVLPNACLANDEALYGAPVPSDAVFIRWLGDAAQAAPKILNYEFSDADLSGEAYVAISNAALSGAMPGDYYSVVIGPTGEITLIQEPARDDKSKVHVVLLNAGAKAVSMTLAGTDRMVIGTTKAGQSNSRAVNPVTARLAIGQDAFDVTLRRGQNMTFAVLEGEIRLIQNTFGPVIVTE